MATRVPLEEIQTIISQNNNPRDQKLILAEKITALYHSANKAAEAKQAFIAQFSKGELPEEIAVKKMKPGTYSVIQLVTDTGLASSKSDARRLFDQKGIKMNQQTVSEQNIQLEAGAEIVLQVGKRKFVKIKS